MIYYENIDLDAIRIAQNPVFIIGCPRSGTTLLQSLLATQKDIFSFRETHFFSILINHIDYDKNNFIKSNSLDAFLENLFHCMAMEIPPSIRTKLEFMAESGKLDVKRLFEIVIYPFLRYKTNNSKEITRIRWIEKTPSHFRSLKIIRSFYPDARFVCIIRHPVPVVLSRKCHLPSDKKLAIATLANQWNEMVDTVENFKTKHPEQIIFIRYEDLVANVIESLRSLTEFLNITYDKDRLRNFTNTGADLILPWEKWKNGVTNDRILNMNSKWAKNFGILNTLIIQMLTESNMKRYKYTPFQKNLQKLIEVGLRTLLGFRPQTLTR
jgi:hypothetical protein